MLIKAVFKSCRSEAGRERSYMKMLRQSLKQISPLKMQLESAHMHARTHTHTQKLATHCADFKMRYSRENIVLSTFKDVAD